MPFMLPDFGAQSSLQISSICHVEIGRNGQKLKDCPFTDDEIAGSPWQALVQFA